MKAAQQVLAWLECPAAGFPYEAVLRAYHQGGKRAVDPELLRALTDTRAHLTATGTGHDHGRLAAFLNAGLDLFENRLGYGTYLGLGLLPLLVPGDLSPSPAEALRRRDRLVVQLVGDLLNFEADAASGMTDLLPRGRPPLATVLKRLRLGLHAIAPAAHRLGLLDPDAEDDPEVAAQRLRFAVAHAYSEHEQLDVRLSLLPVDVVHDEYLYLRVLQACEAALALLATDLRAVLVHLEHGAGYSAVDRINAAVAAFAETRALIPLLTTMSPAAVRFLTVATDEVSSIRSPTWQLVESQCHRLNGAGQALVVHHGGAQARDGGLPGHACLENPYRGAVDEERDTIDVTGRLNAAVSQLVDVVDMWRVRQDEVAGHVLED